MAKIMNVDYEAIPGQANSMRANGKELNAEISEAYTSITNMHDCWYGKRYNELVKSFNQIIPQVNELLELVVGEIPFTLETIANNYSQADQGRNATVAHKEAPRKITNITVQNDIGMKFLTSEVTSTQQKVSRNFQKAKEKMNTIESDYGKIQWQSEASEAFKAKFTKLKNEIINAFDDINTQFTQLMKQTAEDIQSAENANTVQ